MNYAAMTFFILAILTGLFGFSSFEDGGEPDAAAVARIMAVMFAVSWAVAGLCLMARRMRGGDSFGTSPPDSFEHDQPLSRGTIEVAIANGSRSASERGSWNGSRRSAASRRAPETSVRRMS